MLLALLIIVPIVPLTPILFSLAAQASIVDQAATCSPSSSFYNMGDTLLLNINVYSSDNYGVVIFKPDGSATQYNFGYLPVGSYSFTLGYTGPPAGLRQVNLYQSGATVSTCYYSVGQPLPSGCPPYCPTITVTTTFTSTIPFDFTITPSTASVTIQSGQIASLTISVQAVGGGPAQIVTLEATSSGVSPTLNPSSGTPSPSFSSTLTVATTSSTAPGVYMIQITGRSPGGVTHHVSATVTVSNPPPPPPPQPRPLEVSCPWPYLGNQPNCVLDIVQVLGLALVIVVMVAVALFLLARRGGPRGRVEPSRQQTTPAKGSDYLFCLECGIRYPTTLPLCPHCGKPR